jgi:hypothetical protein
LPGELADRRYYFPGDEGAEVKIRERFDRLREVRRDPPRRKRPVEGQPQADPMAVGSEGMRRRQESLRELADEQRRDAGGEQQAPISAVGQATARDVPG